MRNAYECKEEFACDGKCLKRERRIGPVVAWMIVALAALILGKQIPSWFWQLFKW
jgi:hypothetical protein